MRKVSVVIGACSVLALILTVIGQGGPDLDAIMKQVQPTMQSLKKNLDGKMGDGAAADAAKLEMLFRDVEAVFTKMKAQDAVDLAKNARMAIGEAAKAVKAGNYEGALAAHGKAGGACKGCHTNYREKTADGFKLKGKM